MCKLNYSNKHLKLAKKWGVGGGGGGGGGVRSPANPGHPTYAANDSNLFILSWFVCFSGRGRQY